MCIYNYIYIYLLHIHKYTKSRKPRTYGGNIIYNILPLSAAVVVHSSGLRGAANHGSSWHIVAAKKKDVLGASSGREMKFMITIHPYFFANIITILLSYMPVNHTSILVVICQSSPMICLICLPAIHPPNHHYRHYRPIRFLFLVAKQSWGRYPPISPGCNGKAMVSLGH